MFLFHRQLLLVLLIATSVAAFVPVPQNVRSASTTNLAASKKKGATTEVDCLVVGSGVSGASLAFNLMKHQNVSDLLMVERNADVGGNLISKEDDEGFVWEEGPNSFQPTRFICRLVHELGISDDLVLADGSLPRFVYWTGQGAGDKLANLHALPTNLPGDLLDFNLLTWPGKIRAGLGAIGLIAPAPTDKEESIREFVTRHLGAETFERVIDPFVSGVYAGDPDELAMPAALRKIHRLEELGVGPGLVTGAVERFAELDQEKLDNPSDPAWPTYKGGQLGSFRKGLQTLSKAVERKLGSDRVWKHSPVQAIEKRDDGRFSVTIDKDGSKQTVVCRTVCLTSPTRITCDLAADLIPAATKLSEVYSPPVASVTMAYKKEWFRDLPGAKKPDKPLVGFGHLLPRAMGVRSLGTIWSSSLFPGRAPEGWELLLTYIGGARDRGIADMDEDAIYKQVDKDNHEILLRSDAPEGKRIGCRVWKQAIPQYRRGHLDILKAVAEDEKNCPGFFLGGNYRTGVAFGDCVQFGWTEAERVADFLNSSDSASQDVKETKAKKEKSAVA